MDITKLELGAALMVGAIVFGGTLIGIWFFVPSCPFITVGFKLDEQVSCFLKWNATPIGFVLGVLAAGFTLFFGSDFLGLSQRD